MSDELDRRSFLKKSVVAGVGASLAMSLEEKALLAGSKKAFGTGANIPSKQMPMGKIGNVQISRLICGGNLISGFAHSRDLLYVSGLLKHYHTDEKIMETWKLSEEHGINTMIFYGNDPHAVEVFKKYRNETGGKIQWLAQIEPMDMDFKSTVKSAADNGAVGAFLAGNKTDEWARDGRVDLIEKFISIIKDHGIPAGVAAHSLNTVTEMELVGVENDFYMKTLHSNNYWSKRRPGQDKSVIDNYEVDNYWAMTPKETIKFMKDVKKAWIAYKVLAAGAIHPKQGFDYAFTNGADFACVGMFDFQIAQDTAIAKDVLAKTKSRTRSWYG